MSGLPLTAFQVEVARVFFALPEAEGFLLAGGAALAASGLTDRPTQDLDMFCHPPAPAFTLPDQDGNDVSLAAPTAAGKTVVLFFYPKADTPGCTTQACSVRDHREDYAAANAVVLGVSPDPVAAVKKFHAKHDMNFTLLADGDHAVSERFGVWAEKSMYGKSYMGNLRATFIIAPSGEITHAFPKVSPKTHDEVVLEALRS